MNDQGIRVRECYDKITLMIKDRVRTILKSK